MKISAFGPGFEAVYEKGTLFVKYCYLGLIQIVSTINF
jgi:hypothetical protein